MIVPMRLGHRLDQMRFSQELVRLQEPISDLERVEMLHGWFPGGPGQLRADAPARPEIEEELAPS